MRTIEGSRDAAGLRVALVVSRYNAFVSDRLLDGASAALMEAGLAPDGLAVVRVPGAFELPLAAERTAATGHYDAVVCLGCIIRGATPHFEYLSTAVAHGLTAAAAATGVPIGFGVLTTNSVEEAIERAAPGTANKGREAALAAVEMATLLRRLPRQAARGLRV